MDSPIQECLQEIKSQQFGGKKGEESMFLASPKNIGKATLKMNTAFFNNFQNTKIVSY